MRARPHLVALVAAAALASTSCGVHDPYQPSAPPTTPAQAQASPDADEVTPHLSPAQRDAQHLVERVARGFLAGYLPYSYGQASARRIRAATPALRHDLETDPPRVSATVTHTARPRVLQLHTSGLDDPRAYVPAQIDDGSRTYATSLTIERRGRRWLVAAVR